MVRAGEVNALEFGPLRFCASRGATLFEPGRVRKKAVMGFVENQSGNIRILQDLDIVLIQSRQSDVTIQRLVRDD